MARPVLAAAYAEMGRDQDAESERAIMTRLSPFFDARIFAAQFALRGARPSASRAEKSRISLNLAEGCADRRKPLKLAGIRL